MPRIAFWNINTGKTSLAERQLTFQAWCLAMQQLPVPLHLLLLEEVSHTLARDLPGWTNMLELGFVNTLDKNLNQSTKQLWALQSYAAAGNWGFQARALQFPALRAETKTKRMLLKVTMKNAPDSYKNFELWVIHANASVKGGRTAVEAVEEYLKNHQDAVVGGDFNYPVAQASTDAVAPISWEYPNTDLNFTQWNKVGGSTNGPDARLHLPTKPQVQPVMYQEVKPHNVIDYVMVGRNLGAMPVRNCISEQMWIDILKCFDHCPVVYDVRAI